MEHGPFAMQTSKQILDENEQNNAGHTEKTGDETVEKAHRQRKAEKAADEVDEDEGDEARKRV